jgi:hypothetical protein
MNVMTVEDTESHAGVRLVRWIHSMGSDRPPVLNEPGDTVRTPPDTHSDSGHCQEATTTPNLERIIGATMYRNRQIPVARRSAIGGKPAVSPVGWLGPDGRDYWQPQCREKVCLVGTMSSLIYLVSSY